MSSATTAKTHRTEDQLEKLAASLFTSSPECNVLCQELQEAEDQLQALEASGQATAAATAKLVARMRAINAQRKLLRCPQPCFLQ